MISSARLPVQPRLFSPDELRTSDLQLFNSPKCHRIVQVIGGLPALTFALLCEFDPRIDTYVERPCQVSIGPHCFDISFWLRQIDGSECYVLLTTHATSLAPGWHEHRDAMQLRDAATRSGIDLYFALETLVDVPSISEVEGFFERWIATYNASCDPDAVAASPANPSSEGDRT